jgi:Spy/CpxP family protein refolding chaperone
MRESRQKLLELQSEGKADDVAAREAYDAMSAVHQQMLATVRDAQQRIEALLTQEQRDQLTRGERAG